MSARPGRSGRSKGASGRTIRLRPQDGSAPSTLASLALTHAFAAASSGAAAAPTFFALAAAAAAAAATATTDAEGAAVRRLTTVVPDAAASLACRLGP